MRLAVDLRDVLAIAGLVLVSAGVAMLSIPAALIVAGAVLLGVALMPSLLTARRQPPGRT